MLKQNNYLNKVTNEKAKEKGNSFRLFFSYVGKLENRVDFLTDF